MLFKIQKYKQNNFMKRLRPISNTHLRKVACTISAAALMLGVSHATTVGFNFQSQWDGDPTGGGAPAYTGKIVTAAAFGIPTNGWENLAPLRTGYYCTNTTDACNGPFYTNQVISASTSSDGLHPLPQGSLNVNWSATAANVTGFAGYGPKYGAPNPNPGEQQVYYSFLRDEANTYTAPVGGPIPYNVTITGLKSVWTNTPYVIQLIAATDTGSSFANANIGTLVNTQQVTYSATHDPYGVFGGLSTVSGSLNSDSIRIWGDPGTTHDSGTGIAIASTIAGFIITDKPVVTMSPQPVAASVDDNVNLRVIAAGVPPLSYQWRKNGSPIPGATSSSYSITGIKSSANYDVVVTNLYGAAISKVSTVAVDQISIGLFSSDIVVSWTNDLATLQSATAVAGTYLDVPGATSPYTNDVPTQKFFRYIRPAQAPITIDSNPIDQ